MRILIKLKHFLVLTDNLLVCVLSVYGAVTGRTAIAISFNSGECTDIKVASVLSNLRKVLDF